MRRMADIILPRGLQWKETAAGPAPTLLGILIPNPLYGRMGFLFVGGIIFALGVWFYSISVKKFKTDPDAER